MTFFRSLGPTLLLTGVIVNAFGVLYGGNKDYETFIDMDNDGHNEIVTVSCEQAGDSTDYRFAVDKDNVIYSKRFRLPGFSTGFTIADYNGDRLKDLGVSVYGSNGTEEYVLPQLRSGAFDKPVTMSDLSVQKDQNKNTPKLVFVK